MNRRLKQDTGLIPPGTYPGYRLTYVGPGPMDFDWVQDSEGQILKGVGSPDGVVFAPKSTLYQERDEPGLWQNTDGLQAWRQVGAVTANASDFYITSPASTNVPTATLSALAWPALTIGPGILDFSTPTVPVTLAAGEFTVNAGVFLGAGELSGGNPGEMIQTFLRIAGADTPSESLMGLSATDDEYRSLSVTAVLTASATIEIMAFNVDTGLTVSVGVSHVVVTGPPS